MYVNERPTQHRTDGLVPGSYRLWIEATDGSQPLVQRIDALSDLRARNASVREAFLGHLETRARKKGDAPLVILDLGAGTGATMRALHPHLRFPTSWRLAEHDQALMALAAEMAERDGLAAEIVAADLAPGLPAGLLDGIDAVTTSAFLDLVSAGWIDGLAETLARRSLPFLAMLTYDGRQSLEPAHPLAETVRAAMRRGCV